MNPSGFYVDPELSQLEENKPIYIGDKQERRCIVHYDTPSCLSLLSDSNQRPRDYKSRALAN